MAGTAFDPLDWSGYDERPWSNPSSALTDFTGLIDISTLSASWKAAIQSDGGDIRVTKGDNTELAFDLIDFAYNAGSPTGQIRFLWSVTLAASGTQDVRVWAGYTPGTAAAYSASETYGSDFARDSGWALHWPLEEASGTLADRTANGRDGTSGGSPTYGVTAQVGKGMTFSGANYVASPNTTFGIGSSFTIIAWAKAAVSDIRQIFGSDDSITNRVIQFRFDADGKVRLVRWSSAGTLVSNFATTSAWDDDTWRQFAARFDGSAGSDILVDGTVDGSDGVTGTQKDAGEVFYLAARQTASLADALAGSADDVQLHTPARSNAWVAQEFAQASDQSTFWGTWAWTVTGAVNSTSAQTTAPATQSGAGILQPAGTGASVLGATSQAGAGALGIAGAGAQTVASATQAASGDLAIAGSAVQTGQAARQSGSGAETIGGAGAQTAAAAEQAGAGIAGSGVVGTGTQTAAAAEQAGAGAEAIAGAGAQTSAAATQQGSAVPVVTASAAQTGQAAEQAGAGVETVTGVGAATAAAAEQQGSATLEIGGTSAQTLAACLQGGTAIIVPIGLAVQILAAAQQAGAGSVVTAAIADWLVVNSIRMLPALQFTRLRMQPALRMTRSRLRQKGST